jgi:hypothetical protein
MLSTAVATGPTVSRRSLVEMEGEKQWLISNYWQRWKRHGKSGDSTSDANVKTERPISVTGRA